MASFANVLKTFYNFTFILLQTLFWSVILFPEHPETSGNIRKNDHKCMKKILFKYFRNIVQDQNILNGHSINIRSF